MKRDNRLVLYPVSKRGVVLVVLHEGIRLKSHIPMDVFLRWIQADLSYECIETRYIKLEYEIRARLVERALEEA